MKTKKLSKKLILSKKTISNLNMKQLSSIQGGGTRASCNKYTFCVSCYCS
jgi:hypothetical protein